MSIDLTAAALRMASRKRRAATVAGAALLLGACATTEHRQWDIAHEACSRHGGAIAVDMERRVCFCLDGKVCELPY